MTPAAVRKFCAALPAATRDIKWQVDEVYSVGGKMFAVINTVPATPTLSFKVDQELFLPLTDREGIIPAPYMARAKWIQLSHPGVLPDAELKSLLKRSHALVAAGLTAKARRELGIET
jgi:predicted DNA-binding protein (MmcQ/YjbR family)